MEPNANSVPVIYVGGIADGQIEQVDNLKLSGMYQRDGERYLCHLFGNDRSRVYAMVHIETGSNIRGLPQRYADSYLAYLSNLNKPKMYRDHPEYAAFIAAIRHAPADDMPRLAFADWLDEHAGSCQYCWPDPGSGKGHYNVSTKCTSCHGTGTNGAAERAEFIKLQIECEQLLATMPEPPCKENIRAYEINRRCNELLLRGRYSWLPREWGSIECEMSRGFVHAVRLTLAQFERHAGEIAKAHPVEKWVLTDVEPMAERAWASGKSGYGLYNTGRYSNGSGIHPESNVGCVWEFLLNYDGITAHVGKYYYTREAAMLALQRAAYVVARRWAGIEDAIYEVRSTDFAIRQSAS